MAKQIVFETEFDPEDLEITFHESRRGIGATFYESGAWAHRCKSYFETANEAFDYAEEVIARYKRMIEAAQIHFLLGLDANKFEASDFLDQSDQLDPDYQKVINATDDPQEPAKG